MPKIVVEMASNESLCKYFAQCVVNGNLDIYIDQFAPLTGKLDFLPAFSALTAFCLQWTPLCSRLELHFFQTKYSTGMKLTPMLLDK